MKTGVAIILLILTVSAAFAEKSVTDIRAMDYQQASGDTVKDLKKAAFVICDTCPDRLPLKMATKSAASGFTYPLAIKKTTAQGQIDRNQPSMVSVPSNGETQRKFTIYFPLADFHVAYEQRSHLEKVISIVKDHEKPVDIEGFTCQLGSLGFNKKLAVKRAKEVAEIMRQSGVKIGSVKGEGKCCYISDVSSENRRVEITIKGLKD